MTRNPNKKFLQGQSLPGLSLVCILGLFLSIGFIYLFRFVIPALGLNIHMPVGGLGLLLIIFGGTIIAGALTYMGIISWMLVGRLFFTRSQIEKVMNWGPSTAFDRWLLDKFFPEDLK
jgi:uncharacterized membrane protein